MLSCTCPTHGYVVGYDSCPKCESPPAPVSLEGVDEVNWEKSYLRAKIDLAEARQKVESLEADKRKALERMEVYRKMAYTKNPAAVEALVNRIEERVQKEPWKDQGHACHYRIACEAVLNMIRAHKKENHNVRG
jgi:hypothetical protein